MNRRSFLLGAAASSLIVPTIASCGGGGGIAEAQSTAAHRPLWISFLGDSITSLAFARGVPNYTEYALRGINYRMARVGDFGVSGDTLEEVTARIPAIASSGVDVTVVMAGYNNGFSASLVPAWTAMWRELDAAMPRTTTLVACTILPNRLASGRPERQAFLEEVNTYIRSLDRGSRIPGARRIFVADTALGFNWSTMTVDGVHPNAYGAEHAGGIVGQSLARILSLYPACAA